MTPPYEVVAIRRADAPAGTEGSDWHKYEIAFEGSNNIRGFKPGNLKTVTIAVDELVAQLNERHMGKRGRVNLVPTPKKTAGTR
jgi:hypothetical protein